LRARLRAVSVPTKRAGLECPSVANGPYLVGRGVGRARGSGLPVYLRLVQAPRDGVVSLPETTRLLVILLRCYSSAPAKVQHMGTNLGTEPVSDRSFGAFWLPKCLL